MEDKLYHVYGAELVGKRQDELGVVVDVEEKRPHGWRGVVGCHVTSQMRTRL